MADSPTSRTPLAGSGPPPRVLVVDDEPDLVSLCSMILEGAGFAVSSASDGAAALAAIAADMPDLVLLDVMLPHMSGWDVLSALRSDPATAELPVVIVSAKAGTEDQRQGWMLGASDVVVKPYDEQRLLRVIAAALRRDSVEREAHSRVMIDQLSQPSGNIGTQIMGIIDQVHDGVASVDVDGKFTSWNRSCERIFGYSAQEMLGQSFRVLLAPHQEEHVLRVLDDIEQGREVPSVEALRVRKDGTHVLVSRRSVPIRDALGEPCGAWVVFREIGEGADAMFRGLLEAAPDAVVIVDHTGSIAIVNSHAEHLFGYDSGELVGEPVEVLVPERFRSRHPLYSDAFFDNPSVRRLGTGLELYGLHKSGREFPVEISLSPLATEKGVLVSASIRDVTDSKRSEALFRGLLEAAPDAMVIVDADGIITLVNAQTEELFNYERVDLIGQPVEVLIPERFAGSHPAHRERYLANPRVRPMGVNSDLCGMRRDGSEFPVEISLSPLHTDEGLLISAAVRDISQRKREEIALTQAYEREQEVARRLRDLDRLKSEFISTVSHELRTPLTVVMGFAKMLVGRWETTDDATRLHLLNRIAASGQKLEQLIADMLDLTRMEQGRIDVEVESLELDALVDETVARIVVLLEEHELEVRIPAGVTVRADRMAFSRVLDNLLSNAAKFAPAGTRIVVAADPPQAGEVVVRVIDEGPGVPHQEQDRIFERFYRIDDERGVVPGTGIGLAIVKEFVEAQGGQIWVEAMPDGGSSFCFTLPLAGRGA